MDDDICKIDQLNDLVHRTDMDTVGVGQRLFYSVPVMIDATAFRFMAIASLTKSLSVDLKARHPNVVWSDIEDVGDAIAFELPSVSVERVWTALTSHLAPLAAVCQAELN